MGARDFGHFVDLVGDHPDRHEVAIPFDFENHDARVARRFRAGHAETHARVGERYDISTHVDDAG
jgi:hypothetical protein